MPTRLCCCGNCRLGEDNFDRPDANPPTGLWHEISGEWEIKDNELNSISPGILATTICHPPQYPNGSFIATMKLVGASDGTRSFWEVSLGNPTNPAYVVTVSHNFFTSQATLTLWKGNKSLIVHEETYSGVSYDIPLKLCYAPGLAVVAQIGVIPHIEFCDDGIGDDCYSSGGTPVGNFAFREGTFDDWLYELHWLDRPDCEKCPCFCEKSRDDFACYPDILYLSFISIGADSAALATIPLYQSFLNPTSYLWPEKVTWYSEVQGCGSPVGAQWTAKFTCTQEGMGTLGFAGPDYDFQSPSVNQPSFAWVEIGPLQTAWTVRNAIKDESTCNPIELIFPELQVLCAFPSPICFDPPCDTIGCHTPYCTDRSSECFTSCPDIRFTPVVTA